uniref:uncharacterized protein LOC105352635 n=1 Tax=Fragaria vesca subsp. vesca TaxID=101020 RepID=UPI0005C8D55A|nr:PREDICTED: uncharacterized protein LOC105352635 [Fragaria vesca subsp. vesca]
MDQQGICNNKDLSILESDEASETWLVSLHDHDRLKGLQGRNQRFSGTVVSEEELKIRNELEMEVEKDLEEEIKDGLRHLALRLHRLYQHQKERSASKLAFCEVNINIQMEGGTKIEIKETKKPALSEREKGLPPRPSSRSSGTMNPVTKVGSNTKKFDWAKSLRSSGGQGWKV